MAASIVQTLTPSQNQQAASQAAQIATSNTLTIPSNKFVYTAFFDGTNNNRDNLKVSGDKQSTNVALLEEMVERSGAPNVRTGYFPGPGTPGTIAGSSFIPSAVTAQIRATAQDAYNDFANKAKAWLDANLNIAGVRSCYLPPLHDDNGAETESFGVARWQIYPGVCG